MAQNKCIKIQGSNNMTCKNGLTAIKDQISLNNLWFQFFGFVALRIYIIKKAKLKPKIYQIIKK